MRYNDLPTYSHWLGVRNARAIQHKSPIEVRTLDECPPTSERKRGLKRARRKHMVGGSNTNNGPQIIVSISNTMIINFRSTCVL